MARSSLCIDAPAPPMTAMAAYRALRARGHAPLLLASAGAHPDAQATYIACDPDARLRIEGGVVRCDGAVRVDGPPLVALREATRALAAPAATFRGGWVGRIGYAFTSTLEPTLSIASAGADVDLRRCRTVLRLPRAGTPTLHAWDLDGDPTAANARLHAVMQALAHAEHDAPRELSARDAAWTASLDEDGFVAAVETLKQHIAAGDLFQANLATRFRTRLSADPADLFEHLLDANPSPYMALLELDGHAIVSASPEQLFRLRDGIVSSRPIAGTRPRGLGDADAAMEAELVHDAKERAEHTMLVDLVRNDVARVAVPGTVHVPEQASVERYRHVMHLVSRVEGRVRSGLDWVDALAALFPGGTITGAPKHRACRRIAEAEPVARGAYTGSAGYVGFDGAAEWNILIRTLVLADGHADVHAGSGIVADSDPRREWVEAGHKAQALLEAATHGPRSPGARLGEVTPRAAWSPPRGPPLSARVLLIDNYDSFVHNLADYCAALGATVRVIRNDAPWRDALQDATHVILSPGPGRPEEAGSCEELARAAAGRVPVLGVCLGHQALATAHGGRVDIGPPVHGKADAVRHDGKGLFAGLPSALRVGRYHSLHVSDVPPGFHIAARLDDGTVMAMHDPQRRQWGVQFHPESILTDHGLTMLRRFLEAP